MLEPRYLSRRSLAATIPLAVTAAATAVPSAAPNIADPVFAQIRLHKALRVRVNTLPGEDDDPAYKAACREEEDAIQALGDMMPTTLGGAAAQLQYMAEVEGDYADSGSPLLQTVLTVAQALAGGLSA